MRWEVRVACGGRWRGGVCAPQAKGPWALWNPMCAQAGCVWMGRSSPLCGSRPCGWESFWGGRWSGGKGGENPCWGEGKEKGKRQKCPPTHPYFRGGFRPENPKDC
ncbi:hypothetical protein JCM16814_07880 [Desulfobaculum senezii]